MGVIRLSDYACTVCRVRATQVRDVTVVVRSITTPAPTTSSLPSAIASGAVQASSPVTFSFNDPGIVYVELRSLDAGTVALLGAPPPRDYNVLTGEGPQSGRRGRQGNQCACANLPGGGCA